MNNVSIGLSELTGMTVSDVASTLQSLGLLCWSSHSRSVKFAVLGTFSLRNKNAAVYITTVMQAALCSLVVSSLCTLSGIGDRFLS